MILLDSSKTQYKANLHCHSNLSDGTLTPRELVEAYKKEGYSILAITDHEYTQYHGKFTNQDFLMITGYEAYIRPSKLCIYDKYSPEIHLNLIARDPKNTSLVAFDLPYCKYMPSYKVLFRKHVGKIGKRDFSVDYIQKFIDAANENGYMVSLNHPCWSMQDTSDLIQLKNLWSMEVFNTGSMLVSDYAENMPVYDMLIRHGNYMYCHGADDNHNKKPMGDPMCDSFKAWTMIQADSLTYPDVIDALEKGAFYASTGPVIKSIKVEDGVVRIQTSPASRITMHITPKSSKIAYDKEGGVVESGTFKLTKGAPHVYFSVTGPGGIGKAYTRAYKMEELIGG